MVLVLLKREFTRFSDLNKDQPVKRKDDAMRQRDQVKQEEASGVETMTGCQSCHQQSGSFSECDCGAQCCDRCGGDGHGYTCHNCDAWICPGCVCVDDEGMICEECLHGMDDSS